MKFVKIIIGGAIAVVTTSFALFGFMALAFEELLVASIYFLPSVLALAYIAKKRDFTLLWGFIPVSVILLLMSLLNL